MAKKKVYAALEIADREVRLVVFEEFESRLLVYYTVVVPTEGLNGFKIEKPEEVIQAIEQAAGEAQENLGFQIESVLLAIPSDQISRVTQTISLTIEDGTSHIRNFHIEQGIKKALEYQNEDSLIFVNLNKILYRVGGLPINKSPVGMESDSFDMIIDLLYANKQTVFDYVRVTEAAGLKVIDIFVDAYAQAEQSAAIGASYTQPVVQISLEPRHTNLTLISQGRLLASLSMPKGFDYFIKPIKDKYHLSDALCERLLTNLFTTAQERDESIIYADQIDGEHIEISAAELAREVLPNIRKWIADVNEKCEPIVHGQSIRYILVGQGADFPIFKDLIPAFSAPLQIYKESVLGARDGRFSTAFGMGYAWEEKAERTREDKISVNINEMETTIENISRKSDSKNGVTSKFKEIVGIGK